MIDKHLLKLRARDDISREEEEAIRWAVTEVVDAPPRRTFVRAEQTLDVSTILISGIACRRKDLKDGRSQITEVHVAGDFTDLHSFTLKYLDHDVAALTRCSFAVMPHERLDEITRRFPHLQRVYWFATNLDAAIHREWELSLGRRSAPERMAHFFCELYVRLRIVGLAADYSYDLPMTQEHLADTLGLTSVHVNRTLQELRRRELVEFRHGRVRITDFNTLRDVAGFDPAYLYLNKRKRSSLEQTLEVGSGQFRG